MMVRLFPCNPERAKPNPSLPHRGTMTNANSEPQDQDFTEEYGPPQDETELKLSHRQTLALPILAAAPNLTEGAKEAGISEATLRRWRQDEHFRTEMDRLTHEIAETTRQGLKDLVTQGFRVIRELMEDPDPTVRFRAARAAIVYGIQVCKAEELRQADQNSSGSTPEQAEGRKDQETQTG